MKHKIKLSAIGVMALCLQLAACDQQEPGSESSSAQASSADANTAAAPGDVLPFPAPPMGGSVGPTMQESVHKWREAPSHLPEDAPEHPDRHVGRCRIRAGQYLRRRGQHSHAGPTGRGRHRLQPLPHRRDVFADAGFAFDRAQPPSGGRGPDRRVRQRLGWLHRRHSKVLRHHRRGTGPLWLCDLRLRQGSQHAGGPAGQRTLRPHSDGTRLRLFLRLPRRGDLAVGTHPVGEHHPDLCSPRGELRGLPPHRGHGRQGDHLDAAPPRREPG